MKQHLITLTIDVMWRHIWMACHFFDVFNHRAIIQCTDIDLSIRLLHNPGA